MLDFLLTLLREGGLAAVLGAWIALAPFLIVGALAAVFLGGAS